MGRFDHLEMNDGLPDREGVDPNYTGVIDENYYLDKANEAFVVEDYERALAYYSRTLQYNIGLEDGWLGQLCCLSELGELQESIMWSNRALERFPKSSRILAARAVAESRIGRTAAAMGYSDSSLSAQGVMAYTWIARGEVVTEWNPMNAKACFSKAIEMEPHNWEVRARIGRVYAMRECHHQALEHFRQAARLNAESYVCWYWVGRCSEAMGEAQDAATAYRRALSVRPGYARALHALNRMHNRDLMCRTMHAIRRLFTGKNASGG